MRPVGVNHNSKVAGSKTKKEKMLQHFMERKGTVESGDKSLCAIHYEPLPFTYKKSILLCLWRA